MTILARLLSATALAATLAHDAPAQRPRPAARACAYDRPDVSPYIGFDFGGAIPVARCAEGCTWYGGPAFAGSIAVGVELQSRYWLGLEQTGMVMIIADSRNTASMTMATLRGRLSPGLAVKAGVGTSRYTV